MKKNYLNIRIILTKKILKLKINIKNLKKDALVGEDIGVMKIFFLEIILNLILN